MEQEPPKRSCGQKLSAAVVGTIETFFYRYGLLIGRRPWLTLGACLALVAVSALGALRFRQERHPLRLWIPPASDFARDTDWLMTQFGEGYRMQAVLMVAPDVLEPSIMQQLLDIHQRIVNISAKGVTLEDVCLRIPVLNFDFRRKREVSFNGSDLNNLDFPETDEDDFLEMAISFLQPGEYCRIVNSLTKSCLIYSLLDFWKYNQNSIDELKKEDILRSLNETKLSPTYGLPFDYLHLLGDYERNSEGYIIRAGAMLSLYVVNVNFSAVNMDESGNDAGTADWATGSALSWEKEFLAVMDEVTKNESSAKVYYEAGRSYGDISASTMFQDIDKLIVGIILMFFYVQLILSRFNMIECRFILGTVGLTCIGMSFVVACGFCSLLGIPYGPVHTALPFLLLGIGVDDMFVIMACWRNLSAAERQLTIAEKIAHTMKHAGTSITITSLTDVIAFMVGASTILPSLQSFCLYAAVGVLVTYIFQATFFVACFAIDERRLQMSRNGILVCIKHKDYKPNSCSQVNYSKKIFNAIYANCIFSLPGKVTVLLLTIIFTAVSIKGNMELKQKFDPNWFLPEHTHLYKFMQERQHFYPDMGQDAGVYFGRMNYSAELHNIKQLIQTFREQTDILKDVDDWYTGFEKFMKKKGYDLEEETLSDEQFNDYLNKYLFSPNGAKYQKNFRFEEKPSCGVPASPITVSSFDFKFKLFHGPEESLPAMNRVKNLVKSANFSSPGAFATVWGKIFANWVTDEVIDTELYHNLMLACLCVMICTVILIVNVITCFLVFICVLLTLIDVAGMMYFWGLTIDIVSCIGLELAAGLCVDYAAHISHTFLTCTGTRQERALKTVVNMGPAILSGGTATLLSLAVLANSESYIFVSFFKIFLLVVLFGLFHGLIFMPVILSFIGPAPYESSKGVSIEMQPAQKYVPCDQNNIEKEKPTLLEDSS